LGRNPKGNDIPGTVQVLRVSKPPVRVSRNIRLGTPNVMVFPKHYNGKFHTRPTNVLTSFQREKTFMWHRSVLTGRHTLLLPPSSLHLTFRSLTSTTVDVPHR